MLERLQQVAEDWVVEMATILKEKSCESFAKYYDESLHDYFGSIMRHVLKTGHLPSVKALELKANQ